MKNIREDSLPPVLKLNLLMVYILQNVQLLLQENKVDLYELTSVFTSIHFKLILLKSFAVFDRHALLISDTPSSHFTLMRNIFISVRLVLYTSTCLIWSISHFSEAYVIYLKLYNTILHLQQTIKFTNLPGMLP